MDRDGKIITQRSSTPLRAMNIIKRDSHLNARFFALETYTSLNANMNFMKSSSPPRKTWLSNSKILIK